MTSTKPTASTGEREELKLKVTVWGIDGISRGHIRSEQQRTEWYDPTSMGWEYNDIRKVYKTSDYTALITWDCSPIQQINSAWAPAVLRQETEFADACLLLYDSTSRNSFDALGSLYELLNQVWTEEESRHGKPIMVLATKMDLVGDGGPKVTVEEAERFAHGINASLVCGSSVTGDGFDKVVEELVRLVSNHRSAASQGASGETQKSEGKRGPGWLQKLKSWPRSR